MRMIDRFLYAFIVGFGLVFGATTAIAILILLAGGM